ncbi:hypothetical protein F4677DRAFT_447148 [Hypoxylon crocopeplum]|nr:hypothetical protein F4677DRAFT_447148 [Hypoxylon crocopeplum]
MEWASNNPGKATLFGVAGLAIAAPALIAGPVLAIAGFGATGIAPASLAAVVQSGIGNVVAGSAFATLQSAGMAGYGAAVVNGAVQAGGATVALSTGVAVALKKKLYRPSYTHTSKPTNPNLIEGFWLWLKAGLEAINDKEKTSKLREVVEQNWAMIPEFPSVIVNQLKDSMLQRIKAIFDNGKGVDTKY